MAKFNLYVGKEDLFLGKGHKSFRTVSRDDLNVPKQWLNQATLIIYEDEKGVKILKSRKEITMQLV